MKKFVYMVLMCIALWFIKEGYTKAKMIKIIQKRYGGIILLNLFFKNEGIDS